MDTAIRTNHRRSQERERKTEEFIEYMERRQQDTLCD